MTGRQETMVWSLGAAIFTVASATPGLNKISLVSGLVFFVTALIFRLRND